MFRKIVCKHGEQSTGTVTLALFGLSCGHQVFIRKDVPGYNENEAFCRYCAPAWPPAMPPDGGWPKAAIPPQ
jgi:hypothetical protein